MAIHSKVFIQILYIFETRNGLGKPQKLKRNLILERRFNDSRGFQACTAHLEMKIAVPSHFTTIKSGISLPFMQNIIGGGLLALD